MLYTGAGVCSIVFYDTIGEEARQGGAWGYTDTKTPEEFLETYRQVVASLLSSELVQGFCYTQLTDVMQEINGLLSPERRPKMDVARVKAINLNQR